MAQARNVNGLIQRIVKPGLFSTRYELAARPSSIASCQSRNAHAQAGTSTPTPNPRWVDELRARIGKCILWGLKREQADRAGSICREIARDWRTLIAGSEGYLTTPNRTGLYRHEAVWGNMDSMGHVNNVMYNRWAESARVNWMAKFATHIDREHSEDWQELWTSRGTGVILKSIRTDFKFPLKYPDHVTVYHKLRSRPLADSESFVLDVLILSERHRRPAARCEEDIVLYNYQEGKKTAFRSVPFVLEAFEKTFQQQQEATAACAEARTRLSMQVRDLEKDTWDREGAQEDFGSAASK